MYRNIPSNQSGRIQSLLRADFGIALVRTWSSLVRLRPAALRIEAMRMMQKPIMKATMGFNGFGKCCGSDASMMERGIAENAKWSLKSSVSSSVGVNQVGRPSCE